MTIQWGHEFFGFLMLPLLGCRLAARISFLVPGTHEIRYRRVKWVPFKTTSGVITTSPTDVPTALLSRFCDVDRCFRCRRVSR